MEPVGKQQLHVAVAAANDAPAAMIDVRPFFIFLAGADAGTQQNVCICTDERDWEKLHPEVDELALRSDVTDYIRLRDVSKPWRGTAKEDLRLMGMVPRFFPRNWDMVKGGARGEKQKTRWFVNNLTGASIQLQIPMMYREVIARLEGCLLLGLGGCCTQKMRLFNPVTRAVEVLRAVLLSDCLNLPMHCNAAGFIYETETCDDPAVVLYVMAGLHKRVVYTKTGDAVWRVVDGKDESRLVMYSYSSGALSIRGRFYVPTPTGDVRELKLRPRPHLVDVARQEPLHRCGQLGVLFYLQPKVDGGMLLVRSAIMKSVQEFSVNITIRSLTLVQHEDVKNNLTYWTLSTE